MDELYVEYLKDAFNLKEPEDNIIFVDSNKKGLKISVERDRNYEVYNILTKNGNYMFNDWVSKIYPYSGNYAMIVMNHYSCMSKKNVPMINYIDEKGDFLSKEWFDEGSDFENGKALVMSRYGRNVMYYELDENGNRKAVINKPNILYEIDNKIVLDNKIKPNIDNIAEKYELHNVRADYYFDNYARVIGYDKNNNIVYNYMNKDNDLVFDNFSSNLQMKNGFFVLDDNYYTNDNNKVKAFYNYKFGTFESSFGKDDNGFIVYDSKKDNYNEVKYVPLINYDNYIICTDLNDDIYSYDKRTKKYEFIDEENQITHIGINNFKFGDRLFYVGNKIVDISRMSKKGYSSLIAYKDVLSYEEFNEHYLKKVETKKLITEEQLFDIKDDHKEIKLLLIPYLADFDLSNICFDNVKVFGIDFSNTNAKINPQRVYNKDMSNSEFIGVTFRGANFKNVNVCNSKFNKTFMCNIKGCIKNDNTIFAYDKIR